MYICSTSQYSPRTELYPLNPPNKCIGCGQPLQERYRTKPRQIRGLDGIRELVEHVWGCSDRNCVAFEKTYAPPRSTPPRSSYTFEVIQEAGRLRKQDKQTYREISKRLRMRGVKIGRSGSCARHLIQYYEIYELIWAEQELQTQCQGQDIVLAVDGARPENGTQTLYLLANGQQDEVYQSAWRLTSATTDLVEILSQFRTLDLNVAGVVSDKQRALLLAVQEVFGDVPHQYCHYHWLIAACRPLTDADRRLNTFLKKHLRQIRNLTREAATRVQKGQQSLLNHYCLQKLAVFLTVILQAKNKPPFVLKGLINWQRTKSIFIHLINLLNDHQQLLFGGSVHQLPSTVKSLIRMARLLAKILEETVFEAFAIQTGQKWLKSLNEYLDPHQQPVSGYFAPNSDQAAYKRVYLLIQTYAPQGDLILKTLQNSIQTHLTKWQNGLFTCFNYTFIPRTNNRLEQRINQIKKGHAKTTGRRNNHSVLRHQQCFRYTRHLPHPKQFIACCRQTSRKTYQYHRQKYYTQLAPLITEHRIKRNFQGMLDQVFNKITQEMEKLV